LKVISKDDNCLRFLERKSMSTNLDVFSNIFKDLICEFVARNAKKSVEGK